MTCPLPKQDFCIRLTPHEDGVRIRVSQDGVQLCDELAEDWAHAFTTLTRWKVAGRDVIEHEVRYEVLDQEFDTVTASMLLWYGMEDTRESWAPRWPEAAKDWTPVLAQPRMELTSRRRQGDYKDRIQDGRIVARQEVMAVHTIERERLLGPALHELHAERMPALESAFRAHQPA